MEHRLFNYDLAEQLAGNSRKIKHLEDLVGDVDLYNLKVNTKEKISIKHGLAHIINPNKAEKDGES